MVVDGVCRVDMLTVIIAFDVGKNKTLLRDRMFGHSSTAMFYGTYVPNQPTLCWYDPNEGFL